jgi:hypothetical protein
MEWEKAENAEPFQDERIQQLIQQGATTLSEVRIEYDKPLFAQSTTFQQIQAFLKTHRIQDIAQK